MNKQEFNHKCPYCQKDAVSIGVYDDEGNYRGELGCEYESNPWSGLSYAVNHWDGWGECLLCSDEHPMGGMLFDTPEEAVTAWNKIACVNGRLNAAEKLNLEYNVKETVKLLKSHKENTLFPYAAEIIERLEDILTCDSK